MPGLYFFLEINLLLNKNYVKNLCKFVYSVFLCETITGVKLNF